MPTFYLHFNDGRQTIPDEIGVEFTHLDQVYLQVCAAIPGIAQDLLIERRNPLVASFTIADSKGRDLMTVPFSEILSPSEWRLVEVRGRPHGGLRSPRVRDHLALTSFRRMFGAVDVGCVLMDTQMQVMEMNEFGARHSHVDADAIRGISILKIFSELRGEPKANFERFVSLAQAGVVSTVTDMPYLVLDADGRTAAGWWNARIWPIFDDDHRVVGFAEWAEPFIKPTRGGKTEVKIVVSS